MPIGKTSIVPETIKKNVNIPEFPERGFVQVIRQSRFSDEILGWIDPGGGNGLAHSIFQFLIVDNIALYYRLSSSEFCYFNLKL